MPRAARVVIPNCPHHMIQRGHNRQVVFASDLTGGHRFREEIETKLGLRVAVKRRGRPRKRMSSSPIADARGHR